MQQSINNIPNNIKCSNFKKKSRAPDSCSSLTVTVLMWWTACVSVAPRIEPFSFGDPVYDGQSTQVTCFVSEGDPPLDLFWTFSGRAGPAASPLRGGVSVNKMGSKVSMLYIDAASSSRHAGNYTCVATNRAGRADRTATLNVHGKTARRSLPTTLTAVIPVDTCLLIIL